MKAEINRDGCISCGLCAQICPEVFKIVDDGFAAVIQENIPKQLENKAVEAQDGCPVSVITVN